ncbi:S23 ribosomal protein [Desulfosarcina variabilis str. Montpellier]|uniref:four helix bundle protein n=1 Tax=Desulfosarcina variabilis TaxID=2300 RepID=UPI003AFA1C93
MGCIRHFRDLDVYQLAMQTAMDIFVMSKTFPVEERYSLTDQIRRASRSVCANIAEAWRKRRYPKAFVSKLSDAEAEAAETQVWIEFAYKCKYLQKDQAKALDTDYENIQGKIVNMLNQPEKWSIN